MTYLPLTERVWVIFGLKSCVSSINCSCISCDQNGLDDAPLGLQPLKGLAGKSKDDLGPLKLTRNELWERSHPLWDSHMTTDEQSRELKVLKGLLRLPCMYRLLLQYVS